MLFLKIAQTPDIPALNQSEQVQTRQRLAVPVQVWQQQVSLILGSRIVWRAKQNVLLLGASIEDIKHPVQTALIAFGLHVGTNMVGIDVGSLGHIAHRLLGIFLEVLVGAWVYEVDLQVCRLSFSRAAVGHVPAINVIVAEVLDA